MYLYIEIPMEIKLSLDKNIVHIPSSSSPYLLEKVLTDNYIFTI